MIVRALILSPMYDWLNVETCPRSLIFSRFSVPGALILGFYEVSGMSRGELHFLD